MSHTPPESARFAFTERVNCPVCGRLDFQILKKSSYDETLGEHELRRMYSASSDTQLLDQLVRCKGCGLVYLNPRIKQDIILEGYRNAEDPLFIAQNEARILTFRQCLEGIMRRHGVSPGTHPRVLDIGCAGGAFPKAASDLGFEVVGIEPSAWMATRARARYDLDIRAGTLEEVDFKGERFDIITLWDVIEHMADPATALQRIRSLLHPHGLLIVNYPDHESLARKGLRSRWPFFLSVHLYYFSPATITRLLNHHGFQVRETRPHWQKLPLGYVLKRASAHLPFLGMFAAMLEHRKMGMRAVSYNMGQTLVVASREHG
ncbi:MAG: class I SAM-dependent methyltransferase [Magnetococcales bacterium]|nr:class I SAM-dependent methyltransferase [Magnetococcales bacterium]